MRDPDEILRLVDEAHEELQDKKEGAVGTVRVSSSAFFGVMHLCRLIFAFQDRHPQIRVEFVLTDERSDMVRDGIDIAIRIGALPDSELLVRPLGEARQILVASSDYLELHGTPLAPDELSRRDVIRRTDIPRSGELALADGRGDVRIATFTPRLRVNSGFAAREAVIAHRGIAPVPQWLVDDLLDDGRLQRVLPDYSCEPAPLNMLIVPERADITRVRLLKDFLAREITTIPGVSP